MGDETAPSTVRVDLRPTLPTVRDQGARGTCAAFAITGAHEARRVSRGDAVREDEDLSEEVLYWGSLQEMGYPSDGVTLASAARALARWGQPAEALWPYDEGRDVFDPGYAPPPEAVESSNCHRASLEAIPFEVGEIKRKLLEGRPVVVGVLAGRGFGQAPGGRVPLPDPADVGDGHAVLLVGYDEEDRADQGGTFTFRNSWGDAWGDGGYGYLTADTLERLRLGRSAWSVR